MNDDTESWKIVYIPDKPPIPPDQQPTVNVYASVIEPKFANTFIRRLNKIAPLENLRHVKRIQKRLLEGGECQLSMVLCLANENNHQLGSIPTDVQELINSYQLSVFITKICKYAATSKEEWEEQCKLWPTSFHPPTYSIDGITGFSVEDSQSIFSFMKSAVDLAKSGIEMVNAAVIVDPSVKQVIASARDEVCTLYPLSSNINPETTTPREQHVSHTVTNRAVINGCSTLSNSRALSKSLLSGASCLYPWQWSKKQPLESKFSHRHPLRHAAIVAIESSAARDMRLFPSSEFIGDISIEMDHTDHTQQFSTDSVSKRQKREVMHVNNGEELENLSEGHLSISGRPYLCTGYDMYLVWEPCAMCAMALVHQRVRRIFYAFSNANAGALGSVHRLQGEKSLNHHYAVFRVSIPEDLLTKTSKAC